METKEEVKIEVKEATEERTTLKVGETYLYNDVPVMIENFFEIILLDGKDLCNIIPYTPKNYIIPTNGEMKSANDDKKKELGRIIGVKVKVNDSYIIIPDVFFGKWNKIPLNYVSSGDNIDTIIDKIFHYRKDLKPIYEDLGKYTFECDGKKITIDITAITEIYFEIINGTYKERILIYNKQILNMINANKPNFTYTISNSETTVKVFAYGCVGIIEINGRKYKKIIPDMSYFTWKKVEE